MLQRQRMIVEELATVHGNGTDDASDVVALWRRETSEAALRFLDHLLVDRS